MDIGKVIEEGDRKIEVPDLTPAKAPPAPTREPERTPERVKEPEHA